MTFTADVIKKFEDRYIPEPMSGCWLWIGCTDENKLRHKAQSYGFFWVNKGHARAHRFSWMLHHGEIPEATPHVLHKCDVSLCVNPNHLFLGTNDDNVADREAKGRGVIAPAIIASVLMNHARSHCKNGHSLTGDNVAFSRNKRRCRACSRMWCRRQRERLLGEDKGES